VLNFVPQRSRRGTEQDGGLNFDTTDETDLARRHSSFVSTSSRSFLDKGQVSNALSAMLAGLGGDRDGSGVTSRGGSLTSQRSIGSRRVSQMDHDGDVSDVDE
jgi:hypothetical protein